MNAFDEIVNVQPGTIDGDVTINYYSHYALNLPEGLVVRGDLTVNAPNATVNNYSKVDGNIIIEDISDDTWYEHARTNRLTFNAAGKTLVIRGDVDSLNLPVPANIVTTRTLSNVSIGEGVEVNVRRAINSGKVTTITGNGTTGTIKPPAAQPDPDR